MSQCDATYYLIENCWHPSYTPTWVCICTQILDCCSHHSKDSYSSLTSYPVYWILVWKGSVEPCGWGSQISRSPFPFTLGNNLFRSSNDFSYDKLLPWLGHQMWHLSSSRSLHNCGHIAQWRHVEQTNCPTTQFQPPMGTSCMHCKYNRLPVVYHNRLEKLCLVCQYLKVEDHW